MKQKMFNLICCFLECISSALRRKSDLRLARKEFTCVIPSLLGLGNAINALRLAKTIATINPSARVYVLTTFECSATTSSVPDNVVCCNPGRSRFGLMRTLFVLMFKKVDVVINPFPSLRMRELFINMILCAPYRVVHEGSPEKHNSFRKYFTHNVPYFSNEHDAINDLNLAKLIFPFNEKALERVLNQVRTDVCIFDTQQGEAIHFPVHREKIDVIAFHTGCDAKHDYKRWPLASFFELATKIGQEQLATKVILLGSREDIDLNWEERFTQLEIVESLIDKTNIEELMDQIKESSIVISSDSGLGHLSSWFGKPQIVIFGPTTASQVAPVNANAVCLENRECCKSCVLTGRYYSCEKDYECLQSIDPDYIVEIIKEMSLEHGRC